MKDNASCWCIQPVVSREVKDEIALRAVELALEQAESVLEPRTSVKRGSTTASWIAEAMWLGHASSLRRSRSRS